VQQDDRLAVALDPDVEVVTAQAHRLSGRDGPAGRGRG
jgi:hypothetical protein